MYTIYCDESGFTGNDLSSDTQPFFIYASVNIDPAEASALVHEIRNSARRFNKELKGSQLIRTCPSLVNALFQSLQGRVSVLIVDKIYALAAKFFEFMIAPILHPLMHFLQASSFHHFVITTLYAYFKTNEQTANHFLRTFEACMREYNPDRLLALLDRGSETDETSEMLAGIRRLCHTYQHQIREALVDIQNFGGVRKWILDISMPSLASSLMYWGKDGMPLRVYCDYNKALQEQYDLINFMTDCSKGTSIILDGVSFPLYSLVEPIHLVDSKQEPGVQLADIVASAFGAASRSGEGAWGDAFLHQHAALLHPACMMVNVEHMDLSLLPAYTNRRIFDELIRRVATDDDLFADLEFVITQAHADFPAWHALLNQI